MKRLFLLPLLLFILLTGLVLHKAGTYLVRDDAKAKGDVMVILMGSIADRVLEAADLYQEGYAGRVLIVEEGMGPVEMLRRRGADLITNSSQCRNAAIQLGIPADSISLLQGNATSTIMEARAVAEYLKNKPGADTILLVTAPPHTRRAALIFRDAFRDQQLDVTIIACPTKYHHFKGKGWFKRKEDIQSVISEYTKLLAFLTVEQFR
ncbi:MAG: YdcF family protein [Bacteroidales bacterium]|nr:YdcF family protein [Bacteroidales bacterium]